MSRVNEVSPKEKLRRENMAERNRNFIWTNEMRAKISETGKGRPGNRLGISHSEETRQKMSRSQKKRWDNNGLELRLSLIERNKVVWTGRKHSPETIQKQKEIQSSRTWKVGRLSETWTEEQKQQARLKQLGRKHSAETVAKIKSNRWKDIQNHKTNCRCWVHGPKSPTSIEKSLFSLLSEFPEIIEQKRFGRYRVDAYLPPPYHLVFEADGTYWHRNREQYDQLRDQYLLENFNLPVVHLTEEELREAYIG